MLSEEEKRGEEMKVKELIKFLKEQPQNAKVVVIDGEGYDEAEMAELIDVVHKPHSHGAPYFKAEEKEIRANKTIKVVRIW